MNYLALRERPTQFLALTSLLPAEFDKLLTHFAPRRERNPRFHTLDGHQSRPRLFGVPQGLLLNEVNCLALDQAA